MAVKEKEETRIAEGLWTEFASRTSWTWLVAKLVAINVYNVVSDEGHENARWLSSAH